MRRASLRGAAILVSLGVAGCAAGRMDFARLNPGPSYPPKAAGAPILLAVGSLERPYEEVGMIHVSGVARDGYARLNEKLRTQARREGADAVIYVSYGTENLFSVVPFFVVIPYDVLTAQGLAVRFR